jgi:hypothetical protein
VFFERSIDFGCDKFYTENKSEFEDKDMNVSQPKSMDRSKNTICENQDEINTLGNDLSKMYRNS